MRIFNSHELSKICTAMEQGVSENRFLYNFLCENKDFILESSNEFIVEDLWYSEYYYLMCFKLLETIQNEIDID